MAWIEFICKLAVLYMSVFTFSASGEDDGFNCVYTVYIRTSKTFNAGTNSKISVAFHDETGNGVLIDDLVSWGGLMGQAHNYYQRGNLDIFSGLGPCLYRPVCYMELTSDGSGPNHDWYCNYVELTTTGSSFVRCAQQLFTVEQWIFSDQLTVTRDDCKKGCMV